jgi:hypothetical protein
LLIPCFQEKPLSFSYMGQERPSVQRNCVWLAQEIVRRV